MGWTSLNKYRLQGTITTLLTLDTNNSEAGSIPSDYTTTAYDSETYSDSSYTPSAIFEGDYESSTGSTFLSWTASSASGAITYQTNISDDGINYDGWSGEIDALTTKETTITKQYFKLRFIFDPIYWTDGDFVGVDRIGSLYTKFIKDAIIDANEMNENFYHIGQGSMLPRAGDNLVKTTGVFNLGSSTYKWNEIHVNNLVGVTHIGGSMNLIAQTTLSATSSSIEITSINSDDYNYLYLYTNILVNIGSNSSLYMIYNGDTDTSYGWKNYSGVTPRYTSTVEQIELCQIVGTSTGYTPVMINGDMFLQTDYEKYLIGDVSMNYQTNTSQNQITSVWNKTDTTLTSIKIYCNGNMDVGSIFQLWGS